MTPPLDAAPVTTPAEARERVHDLVGSATRAQLWLMMLDSNGQQLPVLIPIDEVLLRADPGSITALVTLVDELLSREAPGGSVIITLERPGNGALTAADQAWAHALRDSFGKVMPITGLFVAHDTDVAALSR